MRTASVRALLFTALALTAALAIAACGDDDSGSGDDESSSSTKPQKLAVEVTERGPNKFALSAPKSVKAGLVEITLKTPAGGRTSHDAQLVRVEGNHSIDEVLKFVAEDGAPTPNWLFAAGGVGQTQAGVTGSTTQTLAPGKYFVIDTSGPEGENVKSYAETGATAQLQVTGKTGTGELPKAHSKITAKDYTFTTRGLKAGRNQVEFDNAGKELHHVIALPYRKGTTLATVKKTFKQQRPPSGPPPVDFESITGSAVLEGGQKQVTQLDLKRGKYALVCFVSDRKGGPPHVAKGMITEAVVE